MSAITRNAMLLCLVWQFGPWTVNLPIAADEPGKLLQLRLDAARRAYKESYDLYREGRTRDVDRIYRWSQRWRDAEEELNASKPQRASALEGHWRRMKQLEDLIRTLYNAGVVAEVELAAVEYYRLDGEIGLSKAKGK